MLVGTAGIYHEGNNTIYLPSGILTKPQMDLEDFIVMIATFNSTSDVKRTLDHELAHFYCDSVKEKRLGKNWHEYEIHIPFSLEDKVADSLVNEGIATYIEIEMNGGDDDIFKIEEWPSEINGFTNRAVYQGGAFLVRPIIEKHGEKGIEHILLHPPIGKEIFKPQEYQQRIFWELSRQ